MDTPENLYNTKYDCIINGKHKIKEQYLYIKEGRIDLLFKENLDTLNKKTNSPIKYTDENEFGFKKISWSEWFNNVLNNGEVTEESTITPSNTSVVLTKKYNTLTVSEQKEVDKSISAEILDEAIGTLQEIRNKRLEGNLEYKDLTKSLQMLIDLHRKIEGKNDNKPEVQVNISLSDIVKRNSEEKIVDIKIIDENT